MKRRTPVCVALSIWVTTMIAGCAAASPHEREALVAAAPEPAEGSGEEASPSAASIKAAFLDPSDPELTEAIRRFQATGEAPVIRSVGFVRFPFGESQPVLTCKPLRVCDVQLEPGERVIDVAVGDSDRWLTSKLESGAERARVAHVVVKPTEFNVSTNLVITTDRRVYHLGLVAAAGENGGYFRSVRFYYPADAIQRWESASAAASNREGDIVAALPSVSPDALHFGYRVSGGPAAWRPTQVFDDGTRVFIRMPDAMGANEAPALFVQSEGEDNALVNYRVRSGYYVVDRLFERAVLALGVGRRQQRVVITRLP